MRSLGYLTAFVLGLLLASTTPVGTGAGLHEFDLLHPLFSHVHVLNGRVLTHEQLAQETAVSATAEQGASTGPSIGSGGGFSSALGGVGLSPTLPVHTVTPVWDVPRRWVVGDLQVPPGREEAPPDPPPL
jgi:hypothetical protein